MLHASEACAAGAFVTVLALVSLGLSVGRPDTDRERRSAASSARSLQAEESAAARALARGDRIDVNRSSAAELELLPGIGPALASRIVSYRNQHGDFASPEALLRVRGIGVKTMKRVRAMVKAGKDAK